MTRIFEISEQPGYPDVEAMLAAARAATGLSDFGAGNFREGLRHLLDSLEYDARMAPVDRAAALNIIHRRLVNRLKIEE